MTSQHQPIQFRCGCGFTKRVSQEYFGKKVKCPKCAAVSVVTYDDSHNAIDLDEVEEFSSLTANDYRDEKEMTAFYAGVAALVFSILVLEGLTAGLGIFILIPVSIFYVWKMRGDLLGSYVKISANQFPQLYQSVKRAESRLNFSDVDVFVKEDPHLNASAFGLFGRKCIVLHTAIVDAMSPKELDFIVGHELSHIKCNHTVLLTLKGNANSTIRIPFVSPFIDFVMSWWSRRCEFTCDRAGLIVCRDVDAAVSALAKLAVGKELYQKMNLDEYLEGQHAQATADKGASVAELFRTHPHTVKRVNAIKAFAENHPEYCTRQPGMVA